MNDTVKRLIGVGKMTYKTSGWAVGSVTLTDVEGKESEQIGLSLFNDTSVAMGVDSAKALVRHLLLLIDDVEKANGEKK